MENLYTLKQVSELLAITKNTVKYRVRKISDEFIIRKDGIIYINEAGLEELKKKEPVQTSSKTTENQQEPPKEPADRIVVIETLHDRIHDLEAQIDLLRNQLEKKDNQIEELHLSLKAEQTINIQNVNLLQQKEETILKLESSASKKGLFSRLFHKG